MSTTQTPSFYVVRVNGHARATYAATTLQEALDSAFPTDDARLEVGQVHASDARAARLMAPPLGWAGPFTIGELEARMRQNATPAGWDVAEPGPEQIAATWEPTPEAVERNAKMSAFASSSQGRAQERVCIKRALRAAGVEIPAAILENADALRELAAARGVTPYTWEQVKARIAAFAAIDSLQGGRS